MKMIKNALGIELPEYIEGYGQVHPYQGVGKSTLIKDVKFAPKTTQSMPHTDKVLGSIREAIQKSGLKDGMTISFHHHLRNGDAVVLMVVKEIDALGIKDLHINASSFIDAHDELLQYIKKGTITRLSSSAIRGNWASVISKEMPLKAPIVFRSHGGRARAIEEGDVQIDVTFVAAPYCDRQGNMNGFEGKSAFGSMGYPMVDVQYAGKVVAITDGLQDKPLSYISINQTYVDYIVEVENIGDPALMASKSVRYTTNPTELLIARKAAETLIALGCIKEGFSFQAGAGGASLAVAQYVRAYMIENNIKGSFTSGGMVSTLIDMLNEGLFERAFDVQTFDGSISKDLYKNPNYVEMSASMYANPHNRGCVAHNLDVMMLSATEIDVNFNVNSLTGSHGILMGAVGGAPDTAAGAKVTMMVVPALRKRLPIVMDKVTHVVTPGDTVDVLITDMGISVNPKRQDLIEKLKEARIPIVDIYELREKIVKLTGTFEAVETTDKIVGIVEYRDGTVLDVIYQVK